MKAAQKLLISTPIFYVNDSPHIGHLYTMVFTDILARRARISKGKDAVVFSTGTDEHGQKIQSSADKNQMAPISFCDRNSEKFRILGEKAGLSNDQFIRTTEDRHIQTVRRFWDILESKGHLKKSNWFPWIESE